MKKIIVFLIIAVITTIKVSALELAPYYNYQLGQGVSVSPEGDLGFLVNLSKDIGAIASPWENQSIMGYYSMQYQGPGLKQQEGREFRERYLNHVFVSRHHWDLGDMTLKTQIGILMERRRSGTNETWASGLYNFNRYGGHTSLEKKILEIDSTVSLGYHYVTFPNYTDMLAEIRAGADASGTAGTQNHHSLRVSYTGNIQPLKFWLSLNPLFFTRQKVASDKVQKDGSFYSDTRQREIIINTGASYRESLTQKIEIVPELDITFRFSNQNYQHFMDMTSTSPVSFHEGFFNYIEPSISLPLSISLSRDLTYFFSPRMNFRFYTSRNPRDKDGSFIDDEKQNRILGVYTTGFRKQTGESSATTLFFTYQNQSSNMNFERYLPYNYSGISLGLRFQMEY